MVRVGLWYTGAVISICVFPGVLCIDHNKQVTDLVEKFWQWRLREAPEYGTKIGIHTNDVKVQELTEEGFTRQKNEAVGLLEEASNVVGDKLTEQNNISLTILKKLLETFINGYKFRKYGMYNNISPLHYPIERWEGLAKYMKFETESDYWIYIARLKQHAIQIGNITTLMREAVKEGTTANKWALTGVIEKLEEELSKPLKETVWASAAFPDSSAYANFSIDLRATIRNVLNDAVLNYVLPAYRNNLAFMKNKYLPNTRPGIGASTLPGGRQYYQECLKWHLTVDMTPEEIHQKGLDEVARIKTLMEAIMEKENFRGATLADYVKYLKSNPSNFYSGENTEEQMLQGYRDIMAEAQGKMSALLRNPPTAPVVVKKQLNPQGIIGSYRAPSLDNSHPGIFWANVFNVEEKPKYRMVSLALHEVWPGHHTDFSYRLEQKLPLFRRTTKGIIEAVPFTWLFFTSYTEGWALYAESLGEEMGMFKDNVDRFGKYDSEIFRAARLVVDTGIHAFNWTRDQAVDYLKKNTASSDYNIEREVNRYIAWPGQACAYKIGELKITELRNRAEHKLGESFDLRDFHEEVLSNGPVPLSILENHIDEWITRSGGIPIATNMVLSLAMVSCLFIFVR